MKAAATVPEWLSAICRCSPSKHPHAAFFPLPFVDGNTPTGTSWPRDRPSRGLDSEAQLLAPLFFDIQNGEERAVHLWRSDGFWDWRLEREKRVKPPSHSQPNMGSGSRAWASVTPVVSPSLPKKVSY